MAITTTIDGVDQVDSVRLETLVIVEMANAGEIGMGGFNRDDVALDDVPALKDVTIEEDRATGNERMFTGVTGVRTIDRGTFKQSTNRQWDVNLWDLNAVLDDEVFQSDGANRPAETDYERVTWLMTTSAMDELGITAGVVPNTNTVDMDAADYRGQGPREVLDQCAEASKKNYFVYDWGDGPKLYYDRVDGTDVSSSLTLSTVLSDVDGSTCFAMEQPSLEKDPGRVYSKIRFQYASGVVWVEDTGTATAFRRREKAMEDSSVKSAAKATAKANTYLEEASTELETFKCSVSVPASQVNDIRAGQRIQIKCPHLGFDSFTWKRISRREVRARQGNGGVSSESYTLALEFAEPRLMGGGGGGLSESDASLTQYQLRYEVGGTYGPAMDASYYTFPPEFDFGTTGDTSAIVSRTPEHNIPWEFRDCGIDAGAPGGLTTREAWYRFQVDLSDSAVLGVRFKVAPFLVFDAGDPDHDYTDSPSGELVGTDTVACGIHCGTHSDGSELSHDAQWNLVGHVGDQGGEVFISRSHLVDQASGYCWFVLAPNWTIDPHLVLCEEDIKPWGYGLTGDPGDDNEIVTASTVSSTDTTLTALGLATGKDDHDALSGLANDDHTQYQLRTEKGLASGYPELDSSTLVPTAQLGTGAASSVTVLLGNQTWGTLAGTGGGGMVQDIDEDGSSFTNWSGLSGTWSSDATDIQQTDSTSSQRIARYSSIVANAVRLFEAEVRVPSGGFAALYVFDGTNGNNGLQVGIDESTDKLIIDVPGGSHFIDYSHTIAAATWYKIRALVSGGSVTAWLDGTIVGTAKLTTLNDLSYLGLIAWKNCDFRNVKGWTLDLPA